MAAKKAKVPSHNEQGFHTAVPSPVIGPCFLFVCCLFLVALHIVLRYHYTDIMTVSVKPRLQCAILLLPCLCSSLVDVKAHPHQRKVAPFKAGDPRLKLDRKALNIFESGRLYQMQIQSASSG